MFVKDYSDNTYFKYTLKRAFLIGNEIGLINI